MKIRGLPELLAPAGSFEALLAAVEAGADAVYVGSKSFGARAYAKNFNIEELERAAVYCRIHGVKLYVTVNTLVLDREIDELTELAHALRSIRPDAVIMADLGAIRIFKSVAPELEIHASTQLSVHNSIGADEAYRLGCKRVVLARELSFDNIKATTEKCKPETEIFIHGALCVSCSGQCLMSSLVGGRSGNRGECAQPCRLPYNSSYPLSLRDLSLASHVKEIIESGVASLKIEGRMKSPSYVYTVTSVYRKLLDERRNASDKENAILQKAFSRGGFTDKYFTDEPFEKMTGIRSEEDKKESRENEKSEFLVKKLPIQAKAIFKLGIPSELTLTLGNRSVKVLGDVPQKAENAPLSEAALKSRLSKMGNTFFVLSEESIEVLCESGINLSPASVNALRRAAVKALEGGAECSDIIALEKSRTSNKKSEKINTALFFDSTALENIEKKKPESLEFFDIIFAPLFSQDKCKTANGVYIPPIIHEDELQEVEQALKLSAENGIRYALIGNISHISLVKDAGLVPVGDFRLNVFNSYAKAELERLGVERTVLSPEISLAMARDIGGGEVVLGRLPLMLTERCFIKENFSCEKCGKSSFTDRTGAKFPIIREWEHRNIILNSQLTYMGDKKRELLDAGITHAHFIFTVESDEQILSLIDSYKKGKPLQSFRRIGSRGV